MHSDCRNSLGILFIFLFLKETTHPLKAYFLRRNEAIQSLRMMASVILSYSCTTYNLYVLVFSKPNEPLLFIPRELILIAGSLLLCLLSDGASCDLQISTSACSQINTLAMESVRIASEVLLALVARAGQILTELQGSAKHPTLS